MKSKNINFQVQRILNHPQTEWREISSKGSSRIAYRDLKIDWNIYTTKDYLFTHDSIVASVAVEEDGFTIKPGCEELVNANGNAWTNEVLLNCYKTFIGGENYQEHIQIPTLSKGKILDAIIRKVKHNNQDIYVVDILVATNRIHKELVRRIEDGELRTLSMGATAKFVQCSVCGKIFDTTKGDKLCDHLAKNIKQFVDYNGKKRFCAELCGAINPQTKEYIPDSCIFIEASWVEEPAFAGAVTNYLIETPEIKAAREERKNMQDLFSSSLLPSLRVADKSGKAFILLLADLKREFELEELAEEVMKEQTF